MAGLARLMMMMMLSRLGCNGMEWIAVETRPWGNFSLSRSQCSSRALNCNRELYVGKMCKDKENKQVMGTGGERGIVVSWTRVEDETRVGICVSDFIL